VLNGKKFHNSSASEGRENRRGESTLSIARKFTQISPACGIITFAEMRVKTDSTHVSSLDALSLFLSSDNTKPTNNLESRDVVEVDVEIGETNFFAILFTSPKAIFVYEYDVTT
jgi:hypothetical protein